MVVVTIIEYINKYAWKFTWYCLRHRTYPQCLTRETLSMLQQTQFLLCEQYPWSNCQLCIDNTTKIKIEVMCASHFWYMYNWYAKQEFSIHRSSLTRGFWSALLLKNPWLAKMLSILKTVGVLRTKGLTF